MYYRSPFPLDELAVAKAGQKKHPGERAEKFLEAKGKDTMTRPLLGRPRIGIPCLFSETPWPVQGCDARVVQCVQELGGQPVPILCTPPEDNEPALFAVWSALQHLDGLLLPGGPGDVAPHWYGQVSHPSTHPLPLWEDWWMMCLTQGAILLQMPLLGICLGCQYFNVACGGSLLQDLAELPQFQGHRSPESHDLRFMVHRIVAPPSSRFVPCLGDDQQEEMMVSCLHHQALDQIAPSLRVTGVSEDGLAHVIECADGTFGVGVQFHPEVPIPGYEVATQRLFAAFLQAAQDYHRQQNPHLPPEEYLFALFHQLSLPSARLSVLSSEEQEQGSGLQRARPVTMSK